MNLEQFVCDKYKEGFSIYGIKRILKVKQMENLSNEKIRRILVSNNIQMRDKSNTGKKVETPKGRFADWT